MQTHQGRGVEGESAFSLLELMCTLFILACFAFFFMPATTTTHDKRKAHRIKCVNNLKNVGLAYRIYAMDHGGGYPWETTNTASTQWTRWTALNSLLAVSNELSTPRIVICPSDNRIEATNWNVCTPANVSYFVCIDSSASLTDSFLAGDRNLMTNGVPFTLPRAKIPHSAELSWTKEIHKEQGNVCVGDGSVQQLSNARLREQYRHFSEITTNIGALTFLFPN